MSEDWVKAAEENHLRKDRECIHCENFFECAGKPKNEKCLNYKERKKNE